jgi:hypothetical protein
MSNRLSFAHPVTRREPHEWMQPEETRPGFAHSALDWLRGLGQSDAMPAAMRRDLGLPEMAEDGVVFACEVERSRLRL